MTTSMHGLKIEGRCNWCTTYPFCGMLDMRLEYIRVECYVELGVAERVDGSGGLPYDVFGVILV